MKTNRTIPIILIAVGTLLISFASASGGEIPFTQQEFASLRGKDICDLQGEFFVRVGVYLDHRKHYLLDYRERDGVYAVFLLSKPSPNCGIIDAILDLTPLKRTGESMEFKCYTRHEGGTTWGKWGRIIGLADNKQGKKRFVKARMAWRVNVKKKRFEEIKGEKVECDTSGYTD
jgi:hypothetical protein